MVKKLRRLLLSLRTGRRLPPGTIAVIRAPALSPEEAASPTLRRATALSLGQPPEALSPVLFRLEEPSPEGAALLGAALSPFPWVLLERGSGRFFTNSPALDRALVLAEGLTEEDIARRTTPFWRVLSIVDPQPAPET